jgi:FdhE protein
VRATLGEKIARATELAAAGGEASGLLGFYGELLRFQKPIFEAFQSKGVTDVRALVPYFPRLIALVNKAGPEPLARFASAHLQTAADRESLLLAYWEGNADGDASGTPADDFFARVLLQPFAESLATRGRIESQSDSATCPFCSHKPAVAALRGEGDGGKRWLICSLCSTEWEYGRIICPNCGEEHKDKLPVYTAEGLEYVRVDACDTCRAYLKSVDLTRNGLAVPVVDELATVVLNIWAEEHDYTKLESNLLGM